MVEYFSQKVLIALLGSGLSRERSYEIVQRSARESWKNKSSFKIIPNREEAISFCLSQIAKSKKSNVLLIAGKGHEKYQEIKGIKYYFDDMKELVEYIAKAIASNPDDVNVTEHDDGDGNITISLDVHPDDKGKVIGRNGRVAQSLRILLRVAAVKNNVRVNLEIV